MSVSEVAGEGDTFCTLGVKRSWNWRGQPEVDSKFSSNCKSVTFAEQPNRINWFHLYCLNRKKGTGTDSWVGGNADAILFQTPRVIKTCPSCVPMCVAVLYFDMQWNLVDRSAECLSHLKKSKHTLLLPALAHTCVLPCFYKPTSHYPPDTQLPDSYIFSSHSRPSCLIENRFRWPVSIKQFKVKTGAEWEYWFGKRFQNWVGKVISE